MILTVEDDQGDAASCQATVTVADEGAPALSCNTPATITPPDAPISFTATANDNCGIPTVEITGYDCFTYNNKGKRIDKTESCVISIGGDTAAIADFGGVGDKIVWWAAATDTSSNSIIVECQVEVVNPGEMMGQP